MTASNVLLLVLLATIVTARFNVSSSYRIDVHSHIVPDFYREALINGGSEIRNGTQLWSEGTIIPDWSFDAHLETMDNNGVDYSILSISAPGVAFLHGNPAAVNLTRRLNNYMFELMEQHPTRINAFCVLPLPNIEATLAEIDHCVDVLGFAGVGLFTNHDGIYLGDPRLDPIFTVLNDRNITAFVHPTVPNCWQEVALGIVPPMFEFPFDTTRAIINLFFTGTRAQFESINFIWCHGGGVLPFLAGRIAGTASLPLFGGFDGAAILEQFRGYFFDTANAVTGPQLAALDAFVGPQKLMTGTDYPFLSASSTSGYPAALEAYGNFSAEAIEGINNQNALAILPSVVQKLGISVV